MELTKLELDRIEDFLKSMLASGNIETIFLRYRRDKKDVDELIKPLGLEERHRKNRNGYLVTVLDSRLIFYNDRKKLQDQLMILSHEIGHIFVEDNEWSADFFAAMFMFVADGALPLLRSRNREHVYSKGGVFNG